MLRWPLAACVWSVLLPLLKSIVDRTWGVHFIQLYGVCPLTLVKIDRVEFSVYCYGRLQLQRSWLCPVLAGCGLFICGKLISNRIPFMMLTGVIHVAASLLVEDCTAMEKKASLPFPRCMLPLWQSDAYMRKRKKKESDWLEREASRVTTFLLALIALLCRIPLF